MTELRCIGCGALVAYEDTGASPFSMRDRFGRVTFRPGGLGTEIAHRCADGEFVGPDHEAPRRDDPGTGSPPG